jgi:ABC-type multidrug transport system ATPase subunit
MDPMNRQYVWSFLEKFKKDRVIVLTTHSMEEADVLGDKIAIMSQGRLKAVGRSIRLKNKFGSGYRISLVVSRGSRVPTVKQMIAQQCPDAVLEEEEFFGNITSPVNTDDNDPAAEDSQMARLCYVASSINVMKKLILFLGQISENKENDGNGLVSSFGVSQTTLEDVFIQTVRK